MNRVFTVTSPAGRTAQTQVDERGRTAKVIQPGRLPVEYGYENGRIATITQGVRGVTFHYDARGDLVTKVGPGGVPIHSTYDAVGRPKTITRPDDEVLSFDYELGGSRVRVTPPGASAHVAEHIPENRVSRYTPPPVDGASAERTSRYDEDGLVHTSTFGDGPGAVVVSVQRDAAGRPEHVTTPRGTFDFSYTTRGQLLGATTPEGVSTQLSYDGPLLTGVTVSGVAPATISFDFDADLNLQIERVQGDPISFTYDADGLLLTAGDLSLERDPGSGLINEASVRHAGWRFAHNEYADVDHRGATFDDQLWWLTSVLSRDAAGRIQSVQDHFGGEVKTTTYGYDAVGRLETVTVDGAVTEHYTYDANGNRLFANRLLGDTAASYDAQDRIIVDGRFEYAHRADGALAAKLSLATGLTTTYQYDIGGDLLAVNLPSGALIEYVLDAQGRRVARKVDGEVTHRWVYAVDGGPAAELGDDGQVITRFVYGERPWVPAYMVRGGRTYMLATDPVGSVRFVLDADSAQIVQRLEYDSFGNVMLDTNRGFQPFGFAGGLYDPQTGLVRLGARDYDPFTGRWTSKDPLLFGGGDTNLYAYAANDPINRVDPSGLSVWSFFEDIWIGAGISASNIINGNEDPLVNAVAGFGDAISAGLTKKIRGIAGLDGFVDQCSDDYRRGSTSGHVFTALHGAASVTSSAAALVRANYLKGMRAIAQAEADIKAVEGARILGKEITVGVGGLLRSRIDLYVELPKVGKVFVEVKSGIFARWTLNQRFVFPRVWTNGFMAYGENAVKAGLKLGVPHDPTPVWTVWYP